MGGWRRLLWGLLALWRVQRLSHWGSKAARREARKSQSWLLKLGAAGRFEQAASCGETCRPDEGSHPPAVPPLNTACKTTVVTIAACHRSLPWKAAVAPLTTSSLGQHPRAAQTRMGTQWCGGGPPAPLAPRRQGRSRPAHVVVRKQA